MNGTSTSSVQKNYEGDLVSMRDRLNSYLLGQVLGKYFLIMNGTSTSSVQKKHEGDLVRMRDRLNSL